MKNSEKTFAQRAREIQRKYSRADYDDIEKKEMINALRKLRDEQEEFRADSGIANEEEQEQYATGGNPNFYDPSLEITTQDFSGVKPMSYSPTSYYESPSTSIAPTAISAGFSLLGNAVGAARMRRLSNNNINLPRVAPNLVNYANERDQLNRSYNSALNTFLRNSRYGSGADRIAALTSLTNSLGQSLSSSYSTEANTNAQIKNQAGAQNAEIGGREVMYNAENRNKYLAERNQYLDNAFAVIPSALRDYREQANNDNLLSSLGKDYGLYSQVNPNESFYDKLRRSMLGNKYQVVNREYANSVNDRYAQYLKSLGE